MCHAKWWYSGVDTQGHFGGLKRLLEIFHGTGQCGGDGHPPRALEHAITAGLVAPLGQLAVPLQEEPGRAVGVPAVADLAEELAGQQNAPRATP